MSTSCIAGRVKSLVAKNESVAAFKKKYYNVEDCDIVMKMFVDVVCRISKSLRVCGSPGLALT
jgi:hypothetical protein